MPAARVNDTHMAGTQPYPEHATLFYLQISSLTSSIYTRDCIDFRKPTLDMHDR